MSAPKIDLLTTFTDVDILTNKGLQKNTSITIENNTIRSIGEIHGKVFPYPGYLLLPGLINSHTHSPMNFLRDRCHGVENMIENIFFKTESQLTSELTKNLSYPYILSGLKSGVTTFNEHYYFCAGIAQAFEKIGLRAYIGETLADLGGAFPSSDGLDHFKRQISQWNYSDRIKPTLCPHAADTVSPEYAKKIADFSKSQKIPMHFHLAQRKSEYDSLIKQYGRTPVELAFEWGWLSERSLAVHLLHVDDKDIELLKDSGTSAVSCPSSQILYEFLAPVEKFYNAGINLSLGTDCAASNDEADVLSELKTLALLLKDRGIMDINLYQNLFKTVTENPAQILDAPVGEITPGKLADIVFVKQTLETLPLRDIWTHIIFSYKSQHVDHVMIDGRFVLYDKKLTLTNESDLESQFKYSMDQIKF